MSLINIIKNYNQYEKSYNLKNKLKKAFDKKLSFFDNIFFRFSFIMFFMLVIPLFFTYNLHFESVISFVSTAFISIVGATALFLFYDNKIIEKKLKNKNSYLTKMYIENSLISFVKKKSINKLNSFFNKYTNNEIINEFQELKNVECSIQLDKKNKFIERNKTKIKYHSMNIFSFKNIYSDAISASKKIDISLFDITKYAIKNISINELKDISKEEIDNVLKKFTLDQKIIISNIIKDRITKKNDKEEELQNNLEILKILKNNNSNITNKNTLINVLEIKK
jgi:hypothetical protein